MEKERYVDLIESMQECLKVSGTGLPGSENVLGSVKSALIDADALIQSVMEKDQDQDEAAHTKLAASVAVFDARFVYLASSVVKHHADGIDANLDTFSADNFAENLISYLGEGGSDWDWSRLDDMADLCFRNAPSYDYVLGTFEEGDVPERVRKPYTAPEKRDANKKKPENVTSVEKAESGIDETVIMMHNVLTAAYRANDRRPICLFRFVVDPTSFGRTVENMFHFSFLVKDGFVELYADENGLPVVSPIKRRPAGLAGSMNMNKNSQLLLSMNMVEWREIVKEFKISTAML